MQQHHTKIIDKNGKRFIAGMILHQIVLVLILFLSAGTINILRFWIFLLVDLVYTSIEVALLIRKNPQLLNWRGKPISSDTAGWDKYLVRLYALFFYTIILISALDFGRFQWRILGSYYTIPGYFLYVTGSVIINWSQYVNAYFERTVRIQIDRNQSVVSNGPYRYIRHPGYIGIIFLVTGIPLTLGSTYGFIASVVCVIVLVIRTYLEDDFLKKRLSGYKEYSKKVKYRLCYGIF